MISSRYLDSVWQWWVSIISARAGRDLERHNLRFTMRQANSLTLLLMTEWFRFKTPNCEEYFNLWLIVKFKTKIALIRNVLLRLE